MRSLLFLMLCFSSLACLQFCKKDPINCKSEKLGDIYFSGESLANFPKPPSSVTYRNAIGENQNFAVSQTNIRIPLNVEKLCESFSLQTHYEYYEGDRADIKYKSGSDSMILEMQMVSPQLTNKKDTAFYENLSILRFEGDAGAQLSLILSNRGHDTLVPITDATRGTRFIGDTTLLGKPFSRVYAGQLVSGSSTNAQNQLYFALGQGLIAFTNHAGQIWVRQ
jgi:hypothetical protein